MPPQLVLVYFSLHGIVTMARQQAVNMVKGEGRVFPVNKVIFKTWDDIFSLNMTIFMGCLLKCNISFSVKIFFSKN